VRVKLLKWLRGLFRPKVLRVWKLGSLEHKVFPTACAVDRLVEVVKEADELLRDGREHVNIVWDDTLAVHELRGSGAVNIVTGPGIRIVKDGNVVRVELEDGESTR
jgi:hypothetical protein